MNVNEKKRIAIDLLRAGYIKLEKSNDGYKVKLVSEPSEASRKWNYLLIEGLSMLFKKVYQELGFGQIVTVNLTNVLLPDLMADLPNPYGWQFLNLNERRDEPVKNALLVLLTQLSMEQAKIVIDRVGLNIGNFSATMALIKTGSTPPILKGLDKPHYFAMNLLDEQICSYIVDLVDPECDDLMAGVFI